MPEDRSTPDLFDIPQNAATQILIGCAGWNVPSAEQGRFPDQGTHLQRYAGLLPAVEINSSFYRPHRAATYARWRDSVPDAFRFSVKVPRTITHNHRLQNIDEELRLFLDGVCNLREKLGCLLVQLPPSLQYDPPVAARFFDELRAFVDTDIACEPRHATWFSVAAAEMFARLKIARVAADPAIVEKPAPALFQEKVYMRLHGSPVIYRSAYTEQYLEQLSAQLLHHKDSGRRVWCIFDNTANGAAMPNALRLMSSIGTAAI